MQAIDKVTAETLRFEVKVGEPVRYKGPVLTVHACEGTPRATRAMSTRWPISRCSPSPRRSTAARPTTRSIAAGCRAARRACTHSSTRIYDIWLIACRTAAPPTGDGKA